MTWGFREIEFLGRFPKGKTGYGIRNVDDRLRLAYGNGYSLNIQSVPGEGTRVRLRLALNMEKVTFCPDDEMKNTVNGRKSGV